MANAIVIERKDNPLYPLPKDYEELTREGRRLARVNACRQWQLHNTVEGRFEKAEAFVRCIDFFDKYYLCPQADAGGNIIFDPYFYDFDPLPTAPFHWDIARARMLYKWLVGVAPRGSAKSKRIAIEIMLSMISRPNFSTIYATSTGSLAKGMGEQIQYQLYNNERIQDDWGPQPEFDGRIKPKRGEGSTGMERFVLMNRSKFLATSAESRQRGGRPVHYYLDDPEYDPKGLASVDNLREWMHILLFKIVLPMIMQAGSGATWMGTFVTKRHFLHHAMEMKEVVRDGVTKTVANDPKFEKWFRIFIPSEAVIDGVRTSAWPQMWPVDEAEKERLKLPLGTQSLDDIKESIGAAEYASEYLGQPGAGGARFFPEIDETMEWWYEKGQMDQYLAETPWKSMTNVCWRDDKGSVKKVPLKEFLATSFVMCLLDTSYTNTQMSDFKVAHVMAVHDGMLFSMDLWSAQCPQEMLIEEGLKLSDKWHCDSIHPEYVKAGISLYEDILTVVRTRMSSFAGVEWLPEVVKYSPGMSSKVGRIASLHMWMKNGRVKLPKHRGGACYGRLELQLVGFNPHSEDGGLEHDDELDTMAWPLRIIRVRGDAWKAPEEPDTRDVVERALEGDQEAREMLPLVFNQLSRDQIYDLIDGDAVAEERKSVV